MGCALQIYRSNGAHAESPIATYELALKAFDAIPWKEEFAHFESLPAEKRNECQPEFSLIDDAGRTLRIFPYSPEWIAFYYGHPILEDVDGSQDVKFYTDSFPAERTHELIDKYFSEDHRPIMKLLEEYPSSLSTQT